MSESRSNAMDLIHLNRSIELICLGSLSNKVYIFSILYPNLVVLSKSQIIFVYI